MQTTISFTKIHHSNHAHFTHPAMAPFEFYQDWSRFTARLCTIDCKENDKHDDSDSSCRLLKISHKEKFDDRHFTFRVHVSLSCRSLSLTSSFCSLSINGDVDVVAGNSSNRVVHNTLKRRESIGCQVLEPKSRIFFNQHDSISMQSNACIRIDLSSAVKSNHGFNAYFFVLNLLLKGHSLACLLTQKE